MSEPLFKIGDRVVRPIYARNSLVDVVGWLHGTVSGVRSEDARNIYTTYFIYEVAWDNAPSQGGYFEAGLTREEDLEKNALAIKLAATTARTL